MVSRDEMSFRHCVALMIIRVSVFVCVISMRLLFQFRCGLVANALQLLATKGMCEYALYVKGVCRRLHARMLSMFVGQQCFSSSSPISSCSPHMSTEWKHSRVIGAVPNRHHSQPSQCQQFEASRAVPVTLLLLFCLFPLLTRRVVCFHIVLCLWGFCFFRMSDISLVVTRMPLMCTRKPKDLYRKTG